MTRTRIAPSPTGFPHVGTMFQALFDYVLAQKDPDGKFVIRIEDTDQARFVAGAEEVIYQSLEWLGLKPDEGPIYGGEYGPYKQSERLELYQKYAQELLDAGHAYYCFCSPERLEQVRKDQQQQGKPSMYDRHCRNLDKSESEARSKTEPHVVRMAVPDNQTITVHDEIRGDINFDSSAVDDQVLIKSDGFPTYHLAVVVDDHLMEITHLVRGEEWISSAPKHVLLYQFFGWPMPVLIHTPLLRNPDKSKLAKRHGHASVSWYQDNGFLPEALVNFLASRVWNHPDGNEIFSLDELVQKFSVDKMHIQGPIIDLNKLKWYNGLYIRAMSDEQLFSRLRPFASDQLSDVNLRALIPLVKERLVTLTDIDELSDFIYAFTPADTKLLLKKSDLDTVRNQLLTTKTELENLTAWSTTEIETALRSLQETNDWHRGQYFMLIRLAVTGKTATPPLFETIEVLGKPATLSRFEQTLTSLKSS